MFNEWLGERLISAGMRTPAGVVRRIARAGDALEMGAWMRSHGFSSPKMVGTREELFEMVGEQVGDKPALYLEFGVWKGDATRVWSKVLRHPDSVLHGFDSFEGLPDAWGSYGGGTFSTEGKLPEIDDSRVTFFKGWFNETLPTYQPPEREVVIFNMDADIYSSTAYVLRTMRSLFREGTYIFFDQFASLGHEERAFREFVDETGLKFRMLGAMAKFKRVLFVCEGEEANISDR